MPREIKKASPAADWLFIYALTKFIFQVLISNICCQRCVTTKFASYNSDMKQEVVLQTLKQKNAELITKFGVKSLLLFGSVARNEATPTSDVDLLVEFNRPVVYFGLFALQDYLEKLLGCPVDLGTPDSLRAYIKERVMGELVRLT